MKTTRIFSFLLVLFFSVPGFSQSPASDSNTVEFKLLHDVKYGDLTAFDMILKAKPSLISLNEPVMEESLLHVAARYNQYEMVKILLAKGLDVNAKNKLGSIPLHLACITGSYPMVNDLLSKGSDIMVVNSRGKTPVEYVANGKNPELFKLFLAKDRNILQSRSADGKTLLFYSIFEGDTAGFSYLLAQKLDVNAGDVNGFTPLCMAVLYDRQDIISQLLRSGADVNHVVSGGNTPITLAVDRENLPAVRLLADGGAKISLADSAGQTALHKSIIAGNLEIAYYLVGKGISVDARDNYGMTALHYASIYGRSGLVKTLIGKGANPALTDNQLHDPIYYSVYYGNTSSEKILLASGAKKPDLQVNILTKDLKPGQAVIHYLNHSGYAIETSKYMLVFDYFHYLAPPDNPSLLNGRIDPAELKGKQIIVFTSHDHGDHYDTTIWKLDTPKGSVQYVMGFKPEGKHNYMLMEAGQSKVIKGVQVNTIKSTDAGVAFLVEADGIVVYHPGDHVNKTSEIAKDFKSEIDYLAGLKKKVDIAYLPVAGCGFPDLESVKTGNYYVVRTLKPEISFSMHAGMEQCAGFSKEACQKLPDSRVEFSKFPGDRFYYTKSDKPVLE